MFNLEEVKRASGLSAGELTRLEEEIRREFEGDEMMFELHLIRAIRAIKEGWVTLEETLSKSERV
ncbi:hypothetical protein [Thermodesulforhabdus norvegica]|uniref:Uncharacterized protein n=1 Tax=Thermodesulforhabdus norvegica TaxID=39841 RepID=A0A1I4TUI7_9BACT|nr:hypothetical protein [Thermodesulforhabdus norvegica]SFM80163.1 hypothetical protein SAMN05660836_01523 [Thermodesulforhabdus norvegica]